MKANAVSLLAIFEPKMQLEVALFQRQYVWNRDEHWDPRWEDISRKIGESIEGRRDPVHFLGAMVLDQQQVRDAALQTIGNLTIITQGLELDHFQYPWFGKKPKLLLHAVLPINQDFHRWDTWDETTIAARSEGLFQRALKIWPRV